MTMNISKLKFYILNLMGILFVLPFFFGWTSHAANDLLQQVMEPSKYFGTIFNLWENVNTVGNKVFKWSFEISEKWISRKPSLIVKITKLLLQLTIALSVTMILYNGLSYIIQTWQWKEWKSLVKNVVLIVVWILVSLFSAIIITLIQSIIPSLQDSGGSSEIKDYNLRIQYRPINQKSQYNVWDTLTWEVRIWVNSWDFSNLKLDYSIPSWLEYSNFYVSSQAWLNFSDPTCNENSGEKICTRTIEWTLKEGTENRVVMEIWTNVKEEATNTDYKSEACLHFNIGDQDSTKVCNDYSGDDYNNTVQSKIERDMLTEENKTRLKDTYKIENYEDLEKTAKKYFKDRGNEAYMDEESWEYMVSLHWVESYMINAYLSEIWE